MLMQILGNLPSDGCVIFHCTHGRVFFSQLTGPLSFLLMAYVVLGLCLGANHSAEELCGSRVARTGGLQGDVPSFVSEGENPGVGRRQRE